MQSDPPVTVHDDDRNLLRRSDGDTCDLSCTGFTPVNFSESARSVNCTVHGAYLRMSPVLGLVPVTRVQRRDHKKTQKKNKTEVSLKNEKGGLVEPALQARARESFDSCSPFPQPLVGVTFVEFPPANVEFWCPLEVLQALRRVPCPTDAVDTGQ